ncbi:MAG TPA: DDE-type integrase/transposase/recombinase [Bacteroidales bacterium]|jgi:putative transposase|nr:DDE-type integrase/transposase/recombinase [Bacillota bacterium]HQI17154.1 DDE-type integrase/transposase/recombinase [Bacillota bacterium]HRT84568.1 DDE-type integrase/transposase/recombinase [Bacteroidales bacterium]
MDEKTRQAIALKRFSIISPVLSGNVKNNREYFQELSKNPVDMPYLGTKLYHYKTFESWLYDYYRYGLDGLTPGFRNDRGKSRKISIELGDKIKEYRTNNPKMPVTILYDRLISERIINPLELSRSSVYRYVADMVLPSGGEGSGESLRFSYQYPGEMWQGDVMYGPYIQAGKKKQQTYLHAFIDDATRMIMYSKFFYEQNFETLRICLKEAMLKNGIPHLIYTDNGKIYRSQQLEYICASMGCTLLHSQPYVPKGRGKIERYFNTVRMRFLSNLTPKDLNSLESLNEAYEKWLDSDYQKKEHSALNGKTPHQSFIDNIDRVKLVTDRNQFNENFLLRISRKVCHDATIQVENILFETDPCLAGKRLEVRYEPEWLSDQTKNLQLYEDGKRIGEAKRIRFFDNAHVQRRFPGNRKKAAEETKAVLSSPESNFVTLKNTISFKDLVQGGSENV